MMRKDDPGGGISCARARALLSDLLDMRRGENPPPGISPLEAAPVREAVEQHVAACAACRGTLDGFEALGAAFAEFDESPVAEPRFEDWAAAVRDRMAKDGRSRHQRPRPLPPVLALDPRPEHGRTTGRTGSLMGWRALVLSGAAAAMLTFAVGMLFRSRQGPRLAKTTTPSPAAAEASKHALAPAPEAPSVAERVGLPPIRPVDLQQPPRTLPSFEILDPAPGMAPIVRSMNLDPAHGDLQRILRWVEQELRRHGSLRVRERMELPENRQGGLFGAVLRVDGPNAMDANAPQGLVVSDVFPDSPAYQVGLGSGDYIMSINELRLKSSTASEVLKFLEALKKIGKNQAVLVEFAHPDGKFWMQKRGTAVLGRYEK